MTDILSRGDGPHPTRPPRVYFYCRGDDGALQEDVIALAEGLRELGVPYYSNVDYWRQSTSPEDYLFRHDPDVRPDDCDIVVVSYIWPCFVRMGDFKRFEQPLPEGLFKPGRQYATLFMVNHDGCRTVSWEPEYRQFDHILRTKYNPRVWHPQNMRPWAYGWTERVIEATAGGAAFSERRRALLVNFGASHPFAYGARDLAHRRFEPKVEQVLPLDRTKDDLTLEPADAYDALMWRQTGYRFSRSYYERLKTTTSVACFCGDIIPPAPDRPEGYLVGGNKARLRRLAFEALRKFDRRAPRAVGADSFRFWEALAAGCATVNIDLDHYGVQMPVMPQSGMHYVGVDFDRVDEAVEQLRDETSMARIATDGRAWAKEHYSPRAVATRFLKLL